MHSSQQKRQPEVLVTYWGWKNQVGTEIQFSE